MVTQSLQVGGQGGLSAQINGEEALHEKRLAKKAKERGGRRRSVSESGIG